MVTVTIETAESHSVIAIVNVVLVQYGVQCFGAFIIDTERLNIDRLSTLFQTADKTKRIEISSLVSHLANIHHYNNY